MLFGHKNRLQIDLGDLQNEKETLASFLKSNLNAAVNTSDHKIILDSEKISVLELQRIVTKYVHRHNLSRTHWVSIKDRTVQVNRFKGGSEKKKEKHKKNKPHQSLTQSWGL